MANDKWYIFADKYGDSNPINSLNRKNMSDVLDYSGGDKKNVYCSSVYGTAMATDWYPTIAVSPVDTTEIKEGMSVIFRLKRSMKFGDLNGYNGMVSFCWVNPEATFMTSDESALPNSLHYSIYDTRKIIENNLPVNQKGGGYGPVIGSISTVYGISVTLFPDEGTSSNSVTPPSGSLHKGTTRVSYYKVSYKSVSGGVMNNDLVGYLPRSIDLSADTTLSINASFDEYHVYINGIKICDIPFYTGSNTDNFNNLKDECRFAMCAMGAWNSNVDFEIRNITSTKIAAWYNE